MGAVLRLKCVPYVVVCLLVFVPVAGLLDAHDL